MLENNFSALLKIHHLVTQQQELHCNKNRPTKAIQWGLLLDKVANSELDLHKISQGSRKLLLPLPFPPRQSTASVTFKRSRFLNKAFESDHKPASPPKMNIEPVVQSKVRFQHGNNSGKFSNVQGCRRIRTRLVGNTITKQCIKIVIRIPS